MNPNAGGGGLRGLSQWVQLGTWRPNKLWRSNSILTYGTVSEAAESMPYRLLWKELLSWQLLSTPSDTATPPDHSNHAYSAKPSHHSSVPMPALCIRGRRHADVMLAISLLKRPSSQTRMAWKWHFWKGCNQNHRCIFVQNKLFPSTKITSLAQILVIGEGGCMCMKGLLVVFIA